MEESNKLVLKKFQDFIGYKFNDSDLLKQALTTPQYGNEKKIPHYDILETIGDAVLKLILSVRIYEKGEIDPGNLTKKKQCIENNKTLIKIADKMHLYNYIFASKNQEVKGAPISAEVLESICGAIFLDSGKNLAVVEQVIVNKFFNDLEDFKEDNSLNLIKNELLDFFQKKLKSTPKLNFEYEQINEKNEIKWVAKNLKVINNNGNEIYASPERFQSSICSTKKEAEKELCMMILNDWKKKINF